MGLPGGNYNYGYNFGTDGAKSKLGASTKELIVLNILKYKYSVLINHVIFHMTIFLKISSKIEKLVAKSSNNIFFTCIKCV